MKDIKFKKWSDPPSLEKTSANSNFDLSDFLDLAG